MTKRHGLPRHLQTVPSSFHSSTASTYTPCKKTQTNLFHFEHKYVLVRLDYHLGENLLKIFWEFTPLFTDKKLGNVFPGTPMQYAELYTYK